MMGLRSLKRFSRGARAFLVFLSALSLSFLWPFQGYTLPTGPNVVHGSVHVERPNDTTMHIHQGTNKAIINWQGFSISRDELVQFFQPGRSSVALNRVVGIDPSIILGTLKANGNIFLINPHGILFGKDAVVNVGGILASTLNIRDEDFLSGNYTFTQSPSVPLSYVINRGLIKAEDGGYVVLSAPLVVNEGTIVANLGKVRIGATTSFVVSFDQTGLINFQISGLESGTPGTVYISPDTIDDIVKEVVNTQGIVEAGEVVEENGVVKLVRASGVAVNTGMVEAAQGSVSLKGAQSAVFPTGTVYAPGGSFYLSGKTFLFNGSVDASTVILDPDNVSIAEGSGSAPNTFYEDTIESLLNTGTDVTIEADNSIVMLNFTTPGDEGIDATGSGNLTLRITDNDNDGTGTISFADQNDHISIAGNITLDAQTYANVNGSLQNIGKLTTTGGNITLLASKDIVLENDIQTGTGGVITINTTGGTLTQDVGVDIVSQGTDIGITAATYAMVSGSTISSNSGDVNISAGNVTIDGSIASGNGDVNFTNISSGFDIPTGSVDAGTGNVRIIPVPGKTIDLGFTNAGALEITDATLDNISTTGTLYVGDANTGDIGIGTVTQPSTDVVITSGGAIIDDGTLGTAISGKSITLVADSVGTSASPVGVSTSGGTISVDTTSGGASGNIYLVQPSGDMLMSKLSFTTDNATVQTIGLTAASGSIDVDADKTITDNLILTADSIDIAHAITGGGNNYVVIRPYTGNTGIDLGTESAGKLSLTDSELDNISNFASLQIGDTNAGSIDVSAAISLSSIDTLLLVAGDSASENIGGSGSIAVENLGLSAAGSIGSASDPLDVDVNTLAAASRVSGDVYITETDDVEIGEVSVAGTTVTGITTNASDINITTTNGSITVSQSITAGGTGDVVLDANSTGNTADISIGANITAGGDIHLQADNSITRTAGVVSGGSVFLEATDGVGTQVAPVYTNANTLGGNVTNGGFYVYEADDVTIGKVQDLITPGTFNGIETNGNPIMVQITGAGDTLTIANGLGVDTVRSNNGDITLIADEMDIQSGADLGISAGSGDVQLAPYTSGTSIDLGVSTPGTYGLELDNDELNEISTTGTVVIGSSSAGVIHITQDISPANFSNLALVTGDTGAGTTAITDETAGAGGNKIAVGTLTFDTPGGVDITTDVDTIAGRSTTSGDIRIDEDDSITVGSGWNGISGLTTTGSDINITTTNGAITVSQQIQAQSNGNITITSNEQAGAGNDVNINADVVANTGTITIQAGDDISQGNNSTIQTNGGNITLTAGYNDTDNSGGITQASGTLIDSGNGQTATDGGDITLTAYDTVSVYGIDARGSTADGDITITSQAANVDEAVNDGVVKIYGDDLTISAVTGIGNASELDTQVNTLTLTNTGTVAGNEDIDINNHGTVTLNSAANNSNGGEVEISESFTGNYTLTVAGDVSSNNGHILLSSAGDMQINSGVSITSGTADIDIFSYDGISINGASGSPVQITGANSAGSKIDINADLDGNNTGAFSMTQYDSINSGAGDVSINAGGNATVSSITATNLDITSTAGSILDDGVDTTYLSASTIDLQAAVDIGSTDGQAGIRPGFLDINASALGVGTLTLAGASGSDIYLNFVNGDFHSNFIVFPNGVSPNNSTTSINSLTIGAESGNIIVDSDIFNVDDSGNNTGIYYDLNLLANNNLTLSNNIVTNEDILQLATGGSLTLTMANITFNNPGGTLTLWADFDQNGTGSLTGGSVGSPITLNNVDNLILIAAEGIDVYTQANSINIAAYNSTSGDINIDNIGNITVFDGTGYVGAPGIDVNGINNDAGGDVNITAHSDVNINAPINTGGGDLTITATGSITHTASGDITTSGGDYTGNFDSDNDGTGSYTMADTGTDAAVIDVGAGNVYLIGGNLIGGFGGQGITISQILADTTSSDVYLITTNGSISETTNEAGGYDIAAHQLVMAAADGISIDNLQVSNLAVENSTSGDITLTNTAPTASGLTINSVSTVTGVQNGGGSITITENSPVTVTSPVSATGNVTIIANDSAGNDDGDITNSGNGTITSSAGNVNLYAAHNINVGADIQAADTLNMLADDSTNTANNNSTGTGSIVYTSGAAIAPTMNLSGVAIGSAANPLVIDAGTLTAHAGSGNVAGDIYLTELNQITLSNVDTFDGVISITAGDTIVATDVATGNNNDITITSTSGNIQPTLINAGTGDVVLTASSGNIVDLTGSITAHDLTLSAGGNIGVGTSVDRVQATGSGYVIIQDTGNIELADINSLGYSIQNSGALATDVTAGGDILVSARIKSQNADVNIEGDDITQNANITTSGNDVSIDAGGTFTMGNDIQIDTTGGVPGTGSIDITASGNVTLGQLITGDASVESTSGSIVAANNTAPEIQANTADLTAATGIGGVNFDTQIGTLTAEVTGTGDMMIWNSGGLTIDSAVTSNGSITIGTGNDMTVRYVNAGGPAGDVTLSVLTSGDMYVGTIRGHMVSLNVNVGGIVDNNGDMTNVVATGLVADSDNGIDLDTAVSRMALHNEEGYIDIFNQGDLTIDAIGTISGITNGGALGSANINLVNVGDLTISKPVSITTNGKINIEAHSPVTISANVSAPGDIRIVAGDNDAASNDDITIAANVNIQSTSGDVTLQAGDDITQAAGGTITAGGGDIHLYAGHDNDGDGLIDMAGKVGSGSENLVMEADQTIDANTNVATLAATTDDSNITITEDNGLALNLVDAGSGDVRITVSAGSLTDNNGAANNIVANNVVLSVVSGDIGTAADSIETDIDTLAVTSAGNAYISEANGIVLNDINVTNLFDLNTSNNGSVNSSAGTKITATSVNITADGAVDINTNIGDITLATTNDNVVVNEVNGLAVNTINAGTGDVTLNLAAGAVTDNNGATNNITGDLLDVTAPGGVDLDTDINTLTADTSGANGNIDINEVNGLALNDVNAGTGDVTLTLAAGALNSNPGAKITADEVTLTAPAGIDVNTNVNTLTAKTTDSDITITEDDTLTVGNIDAGTGDVDITLLAGTLTNQAGTTITADELTVTGAGAIDIDTHVSSLEASTQNADITVDEVDDLALRTVDAGAADISITAGGAITDGNGSQKNIIGDDVVLAAANGIGSGDALETTINTFTATNTNNGVEILDEGGLTVLGITNTNGWVSVTTLSPLNVNGNVTAGGDITLVAGDNDAASNDDITIAANVNIQSTSGDVTLQAGDDITQAAGGTITAGGGDIHLYAGHDNDGVGYIQMQGTVGSGSENLVMTANEGITIEDGAVSLINALNTDSGAIDITNTGDLTIDDTTLGTGFGIKNNSGDVTIDNTGDISIPGTNIAAWPNGAGIYGADVSLTSTGDILLASTGSGTIITGIYGFGTVDLSAQGNITAGSISGSGTGNTADIRAERAITLTAGGDINVQSDNTGAYSAVISTTGPITLSAGGDVNLISSYGDGSIIQSVNTGLTGSDIPSYAITITADNINFDAENISVDAGPSTVHLISTGDVTDTSATTDVRAGWLVVEAGGDVNADTQVSYLNADVGGSLDIYNVGDLTVDDFALGTGWGVDAGSVLIENEGDVFLPGTSGDGIHATGDIEVYAYGPDSSIESGEDGSLTAFESENGDVSLYADSNIYLGTNHYGDVYADSGAVYLTAGGDITVDNETYVDAGPGGVTVDAGGSFSILSTFSTDAELYADGGDITVVAGNNIVMGDETYIYTDGGGSIDLQASGGHITVDPAYIYSDTGDISLDAATYIEVEDGSRIYTGGSGTIAFTSGTYTEMKGASSVTSDDGNITVDAGGDIRVLESSTVTTNSGSIELSSSSSIDVENSTVESTSGDIVALADDSFTASNSTITTGGSGAISIATTNGSVLLSNGTAVTSEDGDITVSAGSSFTSDSSTLGATGSGSIYVVAAGDASFLNSSGALTDTGSIFVNATGIAVDGASTLATGGGDIYLSASQNIGVDGASTVSVAGSGSISMDSGLDTTIAGESTVSAKDGSISVTAGQDVAVDSGSTVLTDDGNITFDATRDINVITRAAGAESTVVSQGNGSVAFTSGRDINILGGEVLTLGSGDISLTAGGDFTSSAGYIYADGGSVYITSTGGDITTENGTLIYSGVDTELSATSGGISLEDTQIFADAGHILGTAAGDMSMVDSNLFGDTYVSLQASNIYADPTTIESNGYVTLTATSGNIDLTDTDIYAHGQGGITMTAPGYIRLLRSRAVSDYTGGGYVSLTAGGDIEIGYVEATDGSVYLTSGGAITDNNVGDMNVVSTYLHAEAENGIGTYHDPIETEITYLEAYNNTQGDIGIYNYGSILDGNASSLDIYNALGNVYLWADGGTIGLLFDPMEAWVRGKIYVGATDAVNHVSVNFVGYDKDDRLHVMEDPTGPVPGLVLWNWHVWGAGLGGSDSSIYQWWRAINQNNPEIGNVPPFMEEILRRIIRSTVITPPPVYWELQQQAMR